MPNFDYLKKVAARSIYSLFFIAAVLGLVRCIDRFEISNSSWEKMIIVDGMITDQPGPYLVKLYNNKSVDRQNTKTVWIKGAQVTITDINGVVETLHEASDGNYVTSNLESEIGNTYTLAIRTPDGATYTSSPEKLLSVGEILDLKFTFKHKQPVPYPAIITTSGFSVTVDTDLTQEQQGQVRWRWAGTWQLTTHPDRAVGLVQVSTNPPIFIDKIIPLPCSGKEILGTFDGGIQWHTIGECSCCVCWLTQHNSLPIVSSTNPPSSKIRAQEVAFIPAWQRYFNTKYYLEVEQLSCSPAAWQFYKTVTAHAEAGTDLFQVTPASIVGNITKTSSGGMRVMGLFSAASIRRKSITIYQSDIPYKIDMPDTLNIDCHTLDKARTLDGKPDFY